MHLKKHKRGMENSPVREEPKWKELELKYKPRPANKRLKNS